MQEDIRTYDAETIQDESVPNGQMNWSDYLRMKLKEDEQAYGAYDNKKII